MNPARLRERMVETQLRARGIRDAAVLAAMGEVPREAFLLETQTPAAYDDGPLPIGEGQTISQPYIVACMAEALALTGSERVLDIGTGSGYAAAVLSRLAAEVYSVERLPALAEAARERLARLGYGNVHVLHADGTGGWQAAAPYQGIQVAASAGEVPHALPEQLDIGGRLVIPLGHPPSGQVLFRIVRQGSREWRREELAMVRFVPLVGGVEVAGSG